MLVSSLIFFLLLLLRAAFSTKDAWAFLQSRMLMNDVGDRFDSGFLSYRLDF